MWSQPNSIQVYLYVQVITDPLTKKIVSVDKGVIRKIAQGDISSVEDKRILKVSLDTEA